MTSRRDELLALAEAALTPFAKLADDIEHACARYAGDMSDPENWAKSCEWEDLIRARAALRALAEQEKPDA